MKRYRGFSLIELIVAFALIVIGFFTFFSVFSTGSHHAVQTQNRAAANLLAQSYMDDFKSHTYGTPAPKVWDETTETPIRMVIKGRKTEFIFHKKIDFENGSFVGKTAGDHDKVTLVISWKEGVGDSQTQPRGNPTGFAEDNKMLTVEMPVWR